MIFRVLLLVFLAFLSFDYLENISDVLKGHKIANVRRSNGEKIRAKKQKKTERVLYWQILSLLSTFCMPGQPVTLKIL